MANLPYVNLQSEKVLGIMKMYSRMGAYPLDATSVFASVEDLLAYISEAGSYAYAGQIVAVANGDVSDAADKSDYSIYVIRSDKTIQEIGKNLHFATLSEAEAFITLNGKSIRDGELLTVGTGSAYTLYLLRADKSLQRVSFEASDVPDVTWANLQNKPTSAVADIDDAVAKRHDHANKTELDKISELESGKPAYDNNELAYFSDIKWGNLADKPTTAADFGITDAITSDDVVDTAAANKLLKLDDEGKLPADITGNAATATNVEWEGVLNKPTTIEGFGITDAVNVSEVVTTAAANKILKLDDEAKLPADILSGIIPIENLPKGALERCVVVANDEARFALTTEDVQLGDTVKVTDTNLMYFVKDVENLNSEAGYEIYTAGAASSVEWAGVLNTPTTLGGYGITDAVHTSEVVTTAEANKVLKLNAEAKLPTSITGDADTVDGMHAADFVPVTDVSETSAIGKLVKVNADNKLPVSITGDADTVDGKHASDFVAATDVVETATANKVLRLDSNAKLPADITGNAATATNVEWTGVKNTPTTVSGYGITDAYTKTEADNLFVEDAQVVETAEAGKILKLNEEAKLPADITGNAATATNVAWAGVQNTPTTIGGYGITDAVNVSEVVTSATANKLLKLDAEGKLPADITGNAATATNVAWTGVQGKPTTIEGFGITDAYTKTEADNLFVEDAEVSTTAEANKLLKLNNEAKLPADITGEAGSVAWANVNDKPTTVAGYGITDAYTKTEADTQFVAASEVVTTAAANKILKLDADAKLPADILSGIIPVANLPHGSLERCVVVANDTARFALTTDDVQLGDTVKVTSTGKMYFVTDDTQLGSEAGYEVYTAGSATSVPWSGVTGTPTTIAGYGITDAYTKDEADGKYVIAATDVVTVAEADKILKLNSEGVLPASITGEAGSVAWANVYDKPTSSVTEIDDAVARKHSHANATQLDKVSEDTNGKLTYNANTVAYISDLSTVIALSNTEPTALPVGGLWFDSSAANA